jgi:hypothetical protein
MWEAVRMTEIEHIRQHLDGEREYLEKVRSERHDGVSAELHAHREYKIEYAVHTLELLLRDVESCLESTTTYRDSVTE